jgi:hypothetical protein
MMILLMMIVRRRKRRRRRRMDMRRRIVMLIMTMMKRSIGLVWFGLVWLLLYAHRHQDILGAAGHIILTLVNQLTVMGLKIWSLFNPGFEPGIFRSLVQRAYQLR